MLRLRVFTICSLLAAAGSQSGPFDVTTIIRLKRSQDVSLGINDWGAKISGMWPWRKEAGADEPQYLPNGTVEVHARTNALGLPLRIRGGVVASDVEDQVPECAAYGPCEGWEVTRWVRESSPGPIPPIQPQRLDGDALAVGEVVRVRLTTRKNPAGGWAIGTCGKTLCGVLLMKGVSKNYEFGYEGTLVKYDDLGYGRKYEWRRSGGPPNVTFEEGTVHTICGLRTTPFVTTIWHEKNRTAAYVGPSDAERIYLRMFSGVGPTTYLREGEEARMDGDPIAVGERVRVHLTNYGKVEVNLGICSNTSCSVVGIEGISKDKRVNYKLWTTRDGNMYEKNPILDSRCITCGSKGKGGLSKSRTNVFVVQRRSPTEMAVWLEDNPGDVVAMPLEPDRNSFKLQTFTSVASFLKDEVFVSRSRGAVLLSPPVSGVSEEICVSLAYMASSKDSGLELSVRTPNGTDIFLTMVLPEKPNMWILNRTVVALPRSVRRSEWRLVITARPASEKQMVLIQRVAGCNHLDEEDVAIIEETSLPLYLPGYNVSWGAPRQRRSPPSRWCANGGQKDDFGSCVCPPGFRGPTCAEGCGPNRYGMDCGGRCSELGDGCRGMILCAPGLECNCAPGFKGDRCDQACEEGQYGAGCTQTCPYCKEGSCDPYTGQCAEEKKLVFGNECGEPPLTSALTVNGMVASPENFPWHGAVYQRLSTAREYKFICGSALVSPKLLISAAHCFYDHNYNRLFPAERYAVALGKARSGWDAPETGNTHKSKVASITIPDSYRGQLNNFMGDISVVELLDAVPSGLSIVPVCLDPAVEVATEEPIKVAGWGNELNALDLLEFVNMPYMPNKLCYRRASDSLIKYVTSDKFCSIIATDSDPRLAKGDSGGGAVVERDGKWYLLGVVSLRQGGTDFTFTNATFVDHLQWISDTLDRM